MVAQGPRPPAWEGSRTLEIIGLDHIYVTVSDLARPEAFYDPLMQAFGFFKGDKPIDGVPHVHYFTDLDGLRLEVVARSKYRQTIVHRWQELEGFVNPLRRLAEKESG